MNVISCVKLNSKEKVLWEHKKATFSNSLLIYKENTKKINV